MIHEPTEYFSKFLDQSMLDKIVEELNNYAIQKNPDKLTNSELEQFIGILYVMSLVKMPSSRMYWCKEFIFEKVAQAISVNRFEHIKNSLHINDNQSCPENCADKLYKLRPLIDYLKKTFNEITPMEKLCTDEKIVLLKEKSALKQYNPQKPKKWEYKLHILSGVDGLKRNFEVHTGAIPICPNQPDIKISENIVLILLQCIPRMKWHKLYFDNWYTSIELVTTLYQQGIACVGSVR